MDVVTVGVDSVRCAFAAAVIELALSDRDPGGVRGGRPVAGHPLPPSSGQPTTRSEAIGAAAGVVATPHVAGDPLTIHADRGTSMASKPVTILLADLVVTASRSRRHCCNDYPYSESQFNTLNDWPGFPTGSAQSSVRDRCARCSCAERRAAPGGVRAARSCSARLFD